MKVLTVDDLAKELQELQAIGCGDCVITTDHGLPSGLIPARLAGTVADCVRTVDGRFLPADREQRRKGELVKVVVIK